MLLCSLPTPAGIIVLYPFALLIHCRSKGGLGRHQKRCQIPENVNLWHRSVGRSVGASLFIKVRGKHSMKYRSSVVAGSQENLLAVGIPD